MLSAGSRTVQPDPLRLGVMLQGSRPKLSSESATLVPAKRQRRVHQAVGIDPHRARLQSSRYHVRLLHIPCPYCRGQSVLISIRHLDHLVQIVEAQSGEHGTKDFLARNLHVVADVAEDRRLDEKSFATIHAKPLSAHDQI